MLKFLPYLMVALIFFSRCAQQSPLSGGERDKKPPELDSTKQVIPANGSLNFSATRITIPLNEYVKLKDKENQILITPFLENSPDIYVKGKKVIVDFKAPFESNTTYIVNFGNSIVDLTEGNVMTNYKYVFSTGAYIDSLKYNAVVYDAFSKTPLQGAYVMLYKDHSDSVIVREKPNYFGITDNFGKCHIENIAEGQYKVVAFLEDNGNYKWDAQKEVIGYIENIFNAASDTLADTLVVFMDLPEELKIEDVSVTSSGKGALTFNRPLPQNFDPSSDSLISTFSYPKTTVMSPTRDTIAFFLHNDLIAGEKYSFGIESLSLRKVSIPLTTDSSLHFKSNAEVGIRPNHDLDFWFSQPITSIDPSKVELRADEKEIAYELVQTDNNRISVEADWMNGLDYDITLYPGAVRSYKGLNNDTIISYFEVLKENDFGQLLTSLKVPNGNYIIELLQEGKVKYRDYVNTNEFSRSYQYLFPGTYILKVIFDENDNGIWDSGDYFTHKQPERIEYYSEPIKIKKGWDTDIQWEIKE